MASTDSPQPSRPLAARWLAAIARAGNHDFCPWANRYVYWLKQPVGWFALGVLASGMIGAMVAPQGWVVCGTLAVVMAMGVIWPALAMGGVSGTIQFDRRRCQEGDSVVLTLTIANRWPWPVWGLLVERGFFQDDEQAMSAGLAGRAVMALARVPGWSLSSFEFEFTPETRGQYPRMQPELTTGFPFGLWSARQPLAVNRSLLAWPSSTTLAASPMVDGRLATVAGALVDRAGDEGDQLSARPYRPGDSLRRVHWIHTAKRDELMVRERQTTARRRVVIELDRQAFRDEGRGAAFDWAIRVVASVSREMHSRACDLTCELPWETLAIPTTPQALQRLLDRLAGMEIVDDPVDHPAATPSLSPRSRRTHGSNDVGGELRITVTDRAGFARRAPAQKSRRNSTSHRYIVVNGETAGERGEFAARETSHELPNDDRPWIELDVGSDVFRQLQRQWERRCHEDWSR
ncbi:MAG: DUF58 domain-containing protein [Pirellulales bacterium]